jgi:hypothetical protein
MGKYTKQEGLKELEKINPALAKLYISYYKKLSREDFLCKACTDITELVYMEERVQLFMTTCTDLSYTNYALDTIKGLIENKEAKNISEFCQNLLEDYEDIDEMLEYITSIAKGQ